MFSEDQIAELKKIAPNLKSFQEGGYSYLLIEKLVLPDHCNPKIVDAVLCPTAHTGYPSRLFFSELIGGCNPVPNWNTQNFRIGGRNWHAFSWRISPNLSLVEQLINHMKGLGK